MKVSVEMKFETKNEPRMLCCACPREILILCIKGGGGGGSLKVTYFQSLLLKKFGVVPDYVS